MSLAPSSPQVRARAIADLRIGLPVMITGTKSYIICATETLHDDHLADLRRLGDVFVALTPWRAQTLKIPAYDGKTARIALNKDATPQWVQALANPADDLKYPMKGPFGVLRGGPCDEISTGIHLAKQARLLPAIVGVAIDNHAPADMAKKYNLTWVNDTLPTHDSDHLYNVASANIPLEVGENSKIHVFRPSYGGEEHYAIEIGNPKKHGAAVLCRLHSACLTGDLLGSLKCDCGPQLRAGMHAIGQEGAGVLLYLNQEGRGIGLPNKLRAYQLQDQGFDTVDANHRLGFEDDERDFRIGADMLRQLGFDTIRLLTNNPQKVTQIQHYGITVAARVPLIVGTTRQNADYISVKAKKSGHIL